MALVTLRWGKKRAVLVSASGALFDVSDQFKRGAVDLLVSQWFQAGWKTADYQFYYPGDPKAHPGLLLGAPPALQDASRSPQDPSGDTKT